MGSEPDADAKVAGYREPAYPTSRTPPACWVRDSHLRLAMDVTCPRCQTDYEFDDALVSERGTTVKCTNCGHQFRVFRPKAGAGQPTQPPELWRIDRRSAEPLELRSLVELQRAIRAGRVSRDDLLRRGEAPARRVGDIPELEPFFPSPRQGAAPNTLPLPSMAEPMIPSPRVPAHTPIYGNKPGSVPPPPRALPVMTPPPPRITERPIAPPPPRLPTPLGLAPAPPEARAVREVQAPRAPDPELDPPTIRRSDAGRAPQPPTERMQPPTERMEPATERLRDAVTQSVRPGPIEPESITQSVPPPRGESYDSLFPSPPKRKSNVGLILGVLLIAGLVGVGATVGRPYLAKLAGGGASSSASSGGGERLTRELSAGDRARSDGDWAGAREAYLRATVVDEKSVAAWDGLCWADTELAMAHWITALATKSALERDQASSIGLSAGKSCARWAELARVEPEGTKKVANDLRPIRAVATQGDGPGVRVYLPAHPGNSVVEALAYLADVPKSDPSALDKATKSATTSLARAEIEKLEAPSDLALVAWGAALSGNPARHGAALAELAKRAPRDALLETLRGLLGADGGVAAADAAPVAASATSTAPTVAPSGAPFIATGPGPVASGGGGPAPEPAGDYRALNEKGHKALASGEVTKAETYFKGALAQHPGDLDALYGLGQIARSRGDHAQAISYFKQVLDTSAGFAPARLALADEQWTTGDKAAASKNYELYLERVSEGSGADRARSRLGKSDPKPEGAP